MRVRIHRRDTHVIGGNLLLAFGKVLQAIGDPTDGGVRRTRDPDAMRLVD
jgi:hypothetical protein